MSVLPSLAPVVPRPGNADVCVVVPVFNEAAVVAEVVAGLRGSFDRVVCVDDGSRDGSAQVAQSAGAQVVRHPVNLGQGAAIQTGVEFALRDPATRFVVTFDADGQHRVEDAEAMLALARHGDVDVVLGSRFLSGAATSVPWSRRALLRAAVLFTRLTSGLPLTDTHNGLRVLNRDAAASLDLTLNGMAHASEILHQFARASLRWREHPVTVVYTDYSRAKGQSNLNAVNIALDMLAHRVRARS